MSADMFGDGLSQGINRTVSDGSQRWLTNYHVIGTVKLDNEAVRHSRVILGQHLGANLANRRLVLLDSMDDSEVRNDNSELERLRVRKTGIELARDLLGAHEVGRDEYYGHFSQYCSVHEGHCANLLVQEGLYVHAYLALATGERNATALNSRVLEGLLLSFFEQQWLFELLALRSEHKRIRELIGLYCKDAAITSFLGDWKNQIEAKSANWSANSVALFVWQRLRKRFGADLADELLLFQRAGNLTIINPRHPYYREESDIILSARGPKEEGATVCILPPDTYVSELSHTNPFRDLAQEQFLHVAKPLILASNARTYDRSKTPLSAEFPEIRALVIGDLWLALHSIARVQSLSERKGIVSLVIEKSVHDTISTEAERLAIKLLSIRNQFLNRCSFDPTQLREYVRTHHEYVTGKISHDDQGRRISPILRINDLQDISTSFVECQKELRRYYEENRIKIDGYLRNPEDYYKKTVRMGDW
jgi:hypothetical protein